MHEEDSLKKKSDIKTYERIVKCEIPSLKALDDTVPPEFENIVMKMLAKDPNDRFERLEDAAAELNHFAHLQDKKAGSKQVANFLKEIFDNTLDERAKELLSDAGKSMKTPSQGTSSFKMAQRSSTGAAASSTGSKSSTDATQVTKAKIKVFRKRFADQT